MITTLAVLNTAIVAALPNVNPNLTFPGSQWIVLGIDVILGAMMLALVIAFFGGIVKAILSIVKRRDSGIGSAAALSIGSVIGIGIIAGGTAWLSQWISFFGK